MSSFSRMEGNRCLLHSQDHKDPTPTETGRDCSTLRNTATVPCNYYMIHAPLYKWRLLPASKEGRALMMPSTPHGSPCDKPERAEEPIHKCHQYGHVGDNEFQKH